MPADSEEQGPRVLHECHSAPSPRFLGRCTARMGSGAPCCARPRPEPSPVKPHFAMMRDLHRRGPQVSIQPNWEAKGLSNHSLAPETRAHAWDISKIASFMQQHSAPFDAQLLTRRAPAQQPPTYSPEARRVPLEAAEADGDRPQRRRLRLPRWTRATRGVCTLLPPRQLRLLFRGAFGGGLRLEGRHLAQRRRSLCGEILVSGYG